MQGFNRANDYNNMTRLECSALRCMAIMSIMIHNFAHKLSNAAPENEFSFSLEHYERFWYLVFSNDFLIQLFSFWGHLGVPVFVFLTGFGLEQKYGKDRIIEWKVFLYNHYKKLLIPLFVGTVSFIIFMYAKEGYLVCSVSRIFVQCTMLLNFISPMHLLPMPYWYLGLTMQFYVIYLLLVHNRKLQYLFYLTIASFIMMAFFSDFYDAIVLSKFNFIGWLAPLCMGVAYSRYQSNLPMIKGIRLLVLLSVSFLMVLIFGLCYYTWLLIPVLIVVMAVCTLKYIPSVFQRRMEFIGKNSLYLLIVHPIVREFVLPLVPSFGRYGSLLLYVFTSIIVVYVFLYAKDKLMKL